MQAILIITSIIAYFFLVLQYKTSAGNGAKDLAGVLSANLSLQQMNKRTTRSLPLMVVSVMLYAFNRNHLLQFQWSEKFIFSTLLLFSICLLVSLLGTERLPDTIKAGITLKEAIRYFSIRVPGLIIYEVFFRAVVLGLLLHWFSMPAAIGLNIMLYALAHAYASRIEFIGSILFGFLLCFVVILNRSVYPAVLLHLLLALPYESILFSKCQLLTKKIKT